MWSYTLRRDDVPAREKLAILCFREKLRRELYVNPYRKPTQVDEEKILRRLDEL